MDCNPAIASGTSPSAVARPATPQNPAPPAAEPRPAQTWAAPWQSTNPPPEYSPGGCTAIRPFPTSSRSETPECSRQDAPASYTGSTTLAADSSGPTAQLHHGRNRSA